MKLHIGHGVDTDLATVTVIRAAAPDLRIAVDAHWVYSVTEAMRLAQPDVGRRLRPSRPPRTHAHHHRRGDGAG